MMCTLFAAIMFDLNKGFNAWTPFSQTWMPRLLVSVFWNSYICLSSPHTQQGVGLPRGVYSTAWLQVDEDSIPTHSSSDTSSPPLSRRKEWGGLSEKFTSRQRWFPSEAGGKSVVRGKSEGGNSEENPWVSEVGFLHSLKRFSILLLSSEQPHRGRFLQNTYLSQLNLMSWQGETLPWSKSPTIPTFSLMERKIYQVITQRLTVGHEETCGWGFWGEACRKIWLLCST